MTVNANRSLIAYIVLTILTCGIYGYIFLYEVSKDMNTMCNGDGQKTPGLLKLILLNIVTCGIYSWFYYYSIGNRLQQNAPRYGLNFSENGTTVLLWQVFGLLLCGVGSFVAMHIIIKNMNAMANKYNSYITRQGM